MTGGYEGGQLTHPPSDLTEGLREGCLLLAPWLDDVVLGRLQPLAGLRADLPGVALEAAK